MLTPRITDGDVKALEDFSEQLEDSVIKLADADSPELCGRSTLYVAALQKLPHHIYIAYKAYVAERPGGSDNLRRLSTWLARYVGILPEARETLAP